MQLKLDIQIIEMDRPEFKKILESLAGFEIMPKVQSKGEWLEERDTARELLAFAESELAVPYQLQLLRTQPCTWFAPNAINSLAKSGTLEAARGLMQITEDPYYNEGLKIKVIDAVYRLRETKKAEITAATEGFVAKYQRPSPWMLAPPVD